MSTDGQDTKWRRNIAENFNRLSRVYERYRRQTNDRRTGDSIIANVNVCSHALKILERLGRIPVAVVHGLGQLAGWIELVG